VLGGPALAAEAQGYEVEGFAPTSRAARQLREAGLEAGTLQGFLSRSPGQHDPRRSGSISIFVDESSLASTNQMREFLPGLAPMTACLLIGDTRQHQGVEAGRPFRTIAGGRNAHRQARRNRSPERSGAQVCRGIAGVRARFPQRSMFASTTGPNSGNTRSAKNASVHNCRSYVESPENTLIVSPDNASRRELNMAVRQELKAKEPVGLRRSQHSAFWPSART
jgi:hypothetical protein